MVGISRARVMRKVRSNKAMNFQKSSIIDKTPRPSKATEARVQEFIDFMSKRRLNITNQRRSIAEAFLEFAGHHTLEEFYQHILNYDSTIGQTTVYRTLKLLCDAGFANEIHFSDGVARYEVAIPDSHHDHIVCTSCGKIVEVYDQRIETIQRELVAEHGFTLRGHVHNLYGLCKDCRDFDKK